MRIPGKQQAELQKKVQSLYHSLRWEEGETLEFKSSKGGLTSEFWPTYSAFANTEGGIILLGVDDHGNIEGLPKLNQRKDDLAKQLNNPSKCSINLLSNPGCITEVELDGKLVLAVRVPMAAPEQKPVYINGHKELCFIRQHESDIHCTEAQVDQMIRDKFPGTQDSHIFPCTGLQDIDTESFNQFRNRRTEKCAEFVDTAQCRS